MKTVLKMLLLVLLFCGCVPLISGAQGRDSVVVNHQKMDVRKLAGKVGPQIIETGVPVIVVINGFVITDTTKARRLVRLLGKNDFDYRYYSAEECLKKWGFQSDHGLIYCETKKNILIDYNRLTIIKK